MDRIIIFSHLEGVSNFALLLSLIVHIAVARICIQGIESTHRSSLRDRCETTCTLTASIICISHNSRYPCSLLVCDRLHFESVFPCPRLVNYCGPPPYWYLFDCGPSPYWYLFDCGPPPYCYSFDCGPPPYWSLFDRGPSPLLQIIRLRTLP